MHKFHNYINYFQLEIRNEYNIKKKKNGELDYRLHIKTMYYNNCN